jgi:hypothetical protein
VVRATAEDKTRLYSRKPARSSPKLLTKAAARAVKAVRPPAEPDKAFKPARKAAKRPKTPDKVSGKVVAVAEEAAIAATAAAVAAACQYLWPPIGPSRNGSNQLTGKSISSVPTALAGCFRTRKRSTM